MPGTKPPNREKKSSRKQVREELKQVKRAYQTFREKVAEYQSSVFKMAVAAEQAGHRVKILEGILDSCMKHFESEPHTEECKLDPCDCGKDAIAETIKKTLADAPTPSKEEIEEMSKNLPKAPEASSEIPASIPS